MIILGKSRCINESVLVWRKSRRPRWAFVQYDDPRVPGLPVILARIEVRFFLCLTTKMTNDRDF